TAPTVAATVPPAAQQPPVTALASAPADGHDVEGRTAAAPQSSPKSNPPSKPQSSAKTNLQSNPQSAVRNPQPEADGRLLVRSRPAGARVSVDGKDYGATPAIVRGLARGAHRVRIAHDGYATNERRFVVTSSRPSQSMTVELEPVRAAAAARPQTPVATQGRFVGALAIDSRPTGAKVFMDGALVGTTPIALPSVAAGSHAIRLEHDGYRHWSSSVRVVASEQNRVTASLER
ncbi:MAG: PEGA domain-containing protein, partial [Vicinamibacterales bacterium]